MNSKELQRALKASDGSGSALRLGFVPKAVTGERIESLGGHPLGVKVESDKLRQRNKLALLPDNIAQKQTSFNVTWVSGKSKVADGLTSSSTSEKKKDETIQVELVSDPADAKTGKSKFATNERRMFAKEALNSIRANLPRGAHAELTDMKHNRPSSRRVEITLTGNMEQRKKAIELVSNHPAVAWVDKSHKRWLLNAYMTSVLQSGQEVASVGDDVAARPLWAVDLDGDGQIVEIGDSGIGGLDIGKCGGESTDMPCFFRDSESDYGPSHRKIAGITNFIGTDKVDGDGHGTHVAGTLLGSSSTGEQENSSGIAKGARMYATDLTMGEGENIFAPLDLYENYFPVTYSDSSPRPTIYSESWGSTTDAYVSGAKDIDKFAYDNEEFLAVIAGGNSGPEARSVNGISLAKNSLSCAASLTPNSDPPRFAGDIATIHLEDNDATEVPASVSGLGSRLEDGRAVESELILRSPSDGCTPGFGNDQDVNGKVVLIEDGNCSKDVKVRLFTQAALDGSGGEPKAIVLESDTKCGIEYFKGSKQRIQSFPVLTISQAQFKRLKFRLDDGEGLTATIEEREFPFKESTATLAPFSSRGPSPDGRTKPDITAPGDSVYSADNAQCCGIVSKSGTSMATPAVAGSAAILSQFLADKVLGRQPTGSLVKALLINGAEEMKGASQYGPPLDPAPSCEQGFGRVNLAKSVSFKNLSDSVEEAPSSSPGNLETIEARLSEGENETMCLEVTEDMAEIRATLVWADPVAAPGSSNQVVNNLDLEMQTKRGTFPRPYEKEFTDGNNVERVIARGLSKDSKILVNVTAVSLAGSDKQSYAVVVSGEFKKIEGEKCSVVEPDEKQIKEPPATNILPFPPLIEPKNDTNNVKCTGDKGTKAKVVAKPSGTDTQEVRFRIADIDENSVAFEVDYFTLEPNKEREFEFCIDTSHKYLALTDDLGGDGWQGTEFEFSIPSCNGQTEVITKEGNFNSGKNLRVCEKCNKCDVAESSVISCGDDEIEAVFQFRNYDPNDSAGDVRLELYEGGFTTFGETVLDLDSLDIEVDSPAICLRPESYYTLRIVGRGTAEVDLSYRGCTLGAVNLDSEEDAVISEMSFNTCDRCNVCNGRGRRGSVHADVILTTGEFAAEQGLLVGSGARQAYNSFNASRRQRLERDLPKGTLYSRGYQCGSPFNDTGLFPNVQTRSRIPLFDHQFTVAAFDSHLGDTDLANGASISVGKCDGIVNIDSFESLATLNDNGVRLTDFNLCSECDICGPLPLSATNRTDEGASGLANLALIVSSSTVAGLLVIGALAAIVTVALMNPRRKKQSASAPTAQAQAPAQGSNEENAQNEV